MATRKFVKYAAPYRSKTFNDTNSFMMGSNGVLSGGEVSSSLGTVTVQPISFIQKGLVVDVDIALSAPMPVNMSAPFHVVLTVSSSVENLGEVITPTFVKRPLDLTPSMTLIAEYDGFEWRQMPYLSPAGIVAAEEEQNIVDQVLGVSSGLITTSSGPNLSITPGSLVASDGSVSNLYSTHTVPKVSLPVAGSSAYDRIDTVVFRKPLDVKERIGVFKNVVGPAFVSGSSTEVETPVTFSTATPAELVTKSSTDGVNTISAFKEGSTLKYRVLDDTLSAGSAVTVGTLVADYDYAQDFSGNLHFVYVRGNLLYHKSVNLAGAVQSAESVIYSYTQPLHHPQVVCVGNINSSVVHILVCRENGAGPREIGYLSVQPNGTPITPYKTWINLTADLRKPSMTKDDDDFLIFVGFENFDTGRAYLWTFDAATATQSQAPTNIGANIELQTDVFNLQTATSMPTTGAQDVKVIRTDAKETFVLWRHFMGSGQYGLAVYHHSYKSKLGYKALMPNNTDILKFSASVDGMSRAYIGHIEVATSDYLKYVLQLEDVSVLSAYDIIYSTGPVTDGFTHFCPRGDLLNGVSDSTSSNGEWLRSTAFEETSLQKQYILPCDTYIAYYRLSDGVISVADTWIGESLPIRRLYEFSHVFGASGTITWGIVGPNKLVTSSIPIRFLSRESVYTVTGTGPGGITIPSGYAWYITIPDDDNSYTLAGSLQKIGTGFLDRFGKRSMPLFWNIGGTLYTMFAPFTFDSGSSGSVGGTISDELLAWLGASSSAPDPSAHGYLSTYYILQSDSLNTAIGKLDTAINSVGAFSTGFNTGILPLTVGTKSVSIVFGSPRATATYRLISQMENLTDTNPMMQPVMTTAKATSGFTVGWPAELDSGNYSLDFILKDP